VASLASDKNGTLYLGVTNDLVRRIYQHKTKALPGFTSRYRVDRLVWFETYDDPRHRNRARKGHQEMAAGMEGAADQSPQSKLE
jgi:predicted GIY-YIG superfamily endonuclease